MGSSKNVNSQTVNSQNVNSQTVNSQNVNSQNVNSQTVNSWNVNSQTVNSWNVNSQNIKISTPKILYFDKIRCICYFITCQTASETRTFDQHQAHFYILCAWDDVMQELKMDNLDDFKTYNLTRHR